MGAMRKIICQLIAVFVLLGAAAAQQPDATNPKFKAETKLVLVPTVVYDSSGKHAAGLTKEQFKLLQDGKEQTVAVFEEVHAAKKQLEPVPTQPSEFGNAIADVQTPRSFTIIAMDLINTPPLAIAQLKQDLIKYIGKMADNGDPTSLVVLEPGHVRVVYDFTTDPKQLAEAVRHLKTQNNPGQANAKVIANIQQEVEQAAPSGGMNDAASLGRQLEAWVNQRAAGDRMARFQQAQTRRDTLATMRTLATALRALPGRKSLIWVSAGFPYAEDNMQMQAQLGSRPGSTTGVNMSPSSSAPSTGPGGVSTVGTGSTGSTGTGTGRPGSGPPGTFSADPMADSSPNTMGADPSQLVLARGVPSSEAINDHQTTWGALNDANISVYPVDASYMSTTFATSDASNKYSSQAMDRELASNKARETVTTFENIAAATGGKPCYNRTDLDNCFRDAAGDGDSYYMLGYYLPAKTKEGWHKLQVKSDTKDLKIRARNGFTYKPVVEDRAYIQGEMLAAVSTNMNSFAVPFKGSFVGMTEKEGKKQVKYELRIPWEGFTVDSSNGNHFALDIIAVAFNAKGEIIGKAGQTLDTRLKPEAVEQIQKGGLRYRNTIDLPPGDYQVRFVVRDNLAGHLGSASAPLKVQ
jgi:VWFA-related protein